MCRDRKCKVGMGFIEFFSGKKGDEIIKKASPITQFSIQKWDGGDIVVTFKTNSGLEDVVIPAERILQEFIALEKLEDGGTWIRNVP